MKWRERSGLNRKAGDAKQNADTEADQLFLRARVIARSGDIDMALRLYADAAALSPQFDAAVEAQGELLDLAGRSEAAMAKHVEARKIRAAMRQGAPDRSRGPPPREFSRGSDLLPTPSCVR